MFDKSSFQVITTPRDLRLRIARAARKFDEKMKKAMQLAMKAVARAVPAYPSPPPSSTYVRTGLLGWMLGKTMSGGVLGNPSVYRFEKKSLGAWEGRVGADKPWYVKRVAVEQKSPWSGYWWNEADWRNLAEPLALKVYFQAAEDMARYVSGQSEKL